MKSQYSLTSIHRHWKGCSKRDYTFKYGLLLRKAEQPCAPYYLDYIKETQILPVLLEEKSMFTLKVFGRTEKKKRWWK